MSDHDTKSIVWAFMIGAAVGGVTALLLAPDRGENTRRKLKEGARHVYDRGGEKVHEMASSAKGVAQALRDGAKEQLEAASVAFQEGKKAYRQELEK
jgi:gas vesicle protein